MVSRPLTPEEAIERAGDICPMTGDVAGYIVLTAQPDGTLSDDWDGRLHPTIEEGRAELRAASRAGCFCLLVECRRVDGSQPGGQERPVVHIAPDRDLLTTDERGAKRRRVIGQNTMKGETDEADA